MLSKRTLQLAISITCVLMVAIAIFLTRSPHPAFDRAGGVTLATFDGERSYGRIHARLLRFSSLEEARAGLAAIGYQPLGSSSAPGPSLPTLLRVSMFALNGTLPPPHQEGVWHHSATAHEMLTPNGIRQFRHKYEYECTHPFDVGLKLPDDLHVGECLVLLNSAMISRGDRTLMELERNAVQAHQLKVGREKEAKRKTLPMEPLRYVLVTPEDERPLDEKDIESLDIQFKDEMARTGMAVATVQLPLPMVEALREGAKKYPNNVHALGTIVINDLLVIGFGMNESKPQPGRMAASLSSLRGDTEDEERRIITILMRKQLREKPCLDPQGLLYAVTESAPEHWTLTTGPDRLRLSYQHGKAMYTLRVIPKPCSKPVAQQALDEVAAGVTWGKRDLPNAQTAIWVERLPDAANGALGAMQRFAGVVCRGAGSGGWSGQPGERTEVHTWDVELNGMPPEFQDHFEAMRRFISSIETTYGKVRPVGECHLWRN